jgi:succinate dehydrogenase / fumarate reductase iron-sulfur subunit
MSFLEMLDVVNNDLIEEGERPDRVRLGLPRRHLRQLRLVINGVAHGPGHGTTTCQLTCASFKDGDTIVDGAVPRQGVPGDQGPGGRSQRPSTASSQAGGYVSVNTGAAPDGNAIPVPKETPTRDGRGGLHRLRRLRGGLQERQRRMLFVSPRSATWRCCRRANRSERRRHRHGRADGQGRLRRCSNEGECEAVCPKQISISSIADERGFTLRVPQVRQVPCESRAGGCDAPTVAARDADLVCTLVDGARNQYLYAQVHVDRIDGVTNFFPQPVYVTDGVWISDGTRVISSGHAATYDYGGGHNNDSLTVDLGDVVYKYYHSSFGFGFRRCQEMDCLQSYAPGAATPTVDGCTRERTRPIVCVRVTDTGTVPPMRDTFMRCAGDGS